MGVKKYIIHKVGKKTISEAVLSNHGFCFNPNFIGYFNIEVKSLKFLNEVWNDSCFEEVNLPEVLFCLNDEEKELFNKQKDIRVLDLPIKFPGSGYRVPLDLLDFLQIIKKVAIHESKINHKLDDYFCYLTVSDIDILLFFK